MKKVLSFGGALLLSVSSLLVFATPKVFAAVKTWDGGGSDDNFSTAANWSGDSTPSNGDSLVFPTSVDADTTSGDDRVLNNDMSNLSVVGISVTGSYGAGDTDYYKITGNNISTSGNVLGNDADTSAPFLTLQIGLTVTGTATIQSVNSSGALAIGSNSVTIKGSSFGGAVTGSGAIVVDGYPGGSGGGCSSTATPRPFSGSGAGYSGAVTVQSDGLMTITKQTTDLARTASGITKESTGLLSLSLDNGQDMSLGTPLTLKGGTVSVGQLGDSECNDATSVKTLTVSGNVTLTQDTTFNLSAANVKFTGTVTGKQYVKVASGGNGTVSFADGSEIKSDLKTWTINDAANCGDYSTSVNNKVVVNADCSGTIAGATFRGILGGTGKVGAVSFASGGILAPGLSPGCLSTGNLVFASGSAYEFEVGGITECSEYDQTRVTGTVTLGDGTLSTVLYNGFKPAKGQTYRIIDNDGNDPVSGTFNTLAEGATFTTGGAVFKISYVGGDGNDVVLTVLSAAAPDTGFALIKNNPLVTILATTLAAGSLLVLSRRSRISVRKR